MLADGERNSGREPGRERFPIRHLRVSDSLISGLDTLVCVLDTLASFLNSPSVCCANGACTAIYIYIYIYKYIYIYISPPDT